MAWRFGGGSRRKRPRRVLRSRKGETISTPRAAAKNRRQTMHAAVRRVIAVFAVWAISIAWFALPAEAVELYLNSFGWSEIYRYDTGTGSTTLINAANILTTGFCDAAAFGPDGFLYAGDAYNIYRIDLSGSQAVWSQYLTLAQQCDSGLTFSPSGTMYLAQS